MTDRKYRKFVGFNVSTETLKEFSVENETDIPDFFAEEGLIRKETDIEYWHFYEITRAFRFQANVSFVLTEE